MFNFINQNFTFPHIEKLFNDFSIAYFANMKKILFSFSILIISASIKAQTQVTHFSGGAFLGFNASQIDGDDMAGYNHIGLNGGFVADYPISTMFSMSMEVLFTQRGSNCHNGPNQYCLNGESNLRMNYAEVPLLLNYHDNKNGVMLGAGFSLGRLVKTVYKHNDVIQNQPPAAPYNNFDYDVVASGTYMFAKHAGINLRYAYSMLPFAHSATSNFVNKGLYSNVVSARLLVLL